ncbi:hypothetical protein [Pseudomonas sp. B19125]|uniref:hypothetical protein n=1 Tax=Pseudomonas sp. B19125 TaxID=3235109 RepID=UPI003783D37F
MASLIPILGPVVAAALTAAIAFVVSVLAKENKTSEFRQAWIEGLRNDVAELLGDFNMLEIALDIYIGQSKTDVEQLSKVDKFFTDNRGEYAKLDALCNKVVLRLNPTEHVSLIEKMRVLEGSIGKGSKVSHTLCSELVNEFSIVLKSEWDRVKNGEPTFQMTKKVALRGFVSVVVGGLIVSFIYIYQSYGVNAQSPQKQSMASSCSANKSSCASE